MDKTIILPGARAHKVSTIVLDASLTDDLHGEEWQEAYAHAGDVLFQWMIDCLPSGVYDRVCQRLKDRNGWK